MPTSAPAEDKFLTTIDVHCHAIRRGYHPETWWASQSELVSRFRTPRDGSERSDASSVDRFVEGLESRTNSMIADMDRAEVRLSVIHPVDWGMLLGEGGIPYLEQNLDYVDLMTRAPDRILAFAGIDPRRGEDGLALFERLVRDFGAAGLKLHTGAGFFANDPAAYPFYAKAVELDVPVLVHTGLDGPPTRGRFGDPIYLNDVCTDFPDLRIAAAHLGDYALTPWRDTILRLMDLHPNLSTDLAGQQLWYQRDVFGFYRRLRDDVTRAGSSRFLWGSDYPYETVPSLASWSRVLIDVPGSVASAGISFGTEEIADILAGNACHWLGSTTCNRLSLTRGRPVGGPTQAPK